MVRLTGNDLLGKLPAFLLPQAQSIFFEPLTVNSHAACCAVEDSAFTNPEHRASPEKVSNSSHEITLRQMVLPLATAKANKGLVQLQALEMLQPFLWRLCSP